MSDDDQAPMPSAPPSNTMDFIQGYSDIPMDDGRYECRLCIVLHGLYWLLDTGVHCQLLAVNSAEVYMTVCVNVFEVDAVE